MPITPNNLKFLAAERATDNPDGGGVVFGDFFFDELVGGTVAAVCVNNDGSMTYKPAATGSDKKLYLNTGFLFARLSAVGGDRIVTLNAGGFIAT
jgi:hypothetical protein